MCQRNDRSRWYSSPVVQCWRGRRGAPTWAEHVTLLPPPALPALRLPLLRLLLRWHDGGHGLAHSIPHLFGQVTALGKKGPGTRAAGRQYWVRCRVLRRGPPNSAPAMPAFQLTWQAGRPRQRSRTRTCRRRPWLPGSGRSAPAAGVRWRVPPPLLLPDASDRRRPALRSANPGPARPAPAACKAGTRWAGASRRFERPLRTSVCRRRLHCFKDDDRSLDCRNRMLDPLCMATMAVMDAYSCRAPKLKTFMFSG